MMKKSQSFPSIATVIRRVFVWTCMVVTLLCIGVGIIKYWNDQAVAVRKVASDLGKNTATYYAYMVSLQLQQDQQGIQNLLYTIQNEEKLLDIAIISDIPTTSSINCEQETLQGFLIHLPLCMFFREDNVTVYQALRSGGAQLGYLKKTQQLPSKTWKNLRGIGVVFCVWIISIAVLSTMMRLRLQRLIIDPLCKLVSNPHDFLTKKSTISTCVRELDLLAHTVQDAHNDLQMARSEQERLDADAKVGRIASQVAHDIRSPLTALKVVSGHLAELPEEKRVMIRNAVQRIDDIANDLVERKGVEQSNTSKCVTLEKKAPSIHLLSSLIEPLISEKRTQYRGKLDVQIESTLDASSYGLFAAVQPTEFKRVLSNLINNAVEALGSEGVVMVSLQSEGEKIVISVQDNGPGIPEEILPKLMERGATFGKPSGSGLGLAHTREMVELWGGSVAIDSKVGKGTIVTVTLPRETPPSWFVPTLQVVSGMTIAIIDDALCGNERGTLGIAIKE